MGSFFFFSFSNLYVANLVFQCIGCRKDLTFQESFRETRKRKVLFDVVLTVQFDALSTFISSLLYLIFQILNIKRLSLVL